MAGFRLIVAEKPSVARDLAKALGVSGRAPGSIGRGAVRISWCLGHLVELAEPQEYDRAWSGWSVETLPMVPSTFKLRPRQNTLI